MERFVIDRANLIVFARIVGYLDEAKVAEMIVVSRQAARQLGEAFGRHCLLYDLTNADLVSNGAVETIRRMMSDPAGKSLWAHRVAFYSPSVLMQLQMQRVSTARPGIAVFPDRRSAIAWFQAERTAAAA